MRKKSEFPFLELDYGFAIKMLRIRRRLSQKELAEKTGIKSNYLSLLEHHKYIPEDALKKIATGLEITIDDIKEEAKKYFINWELKEILRELVSVYGFEKVENVINEEYQKIKGGKNGDL